MTFPVIRHINDVLPALVGHPEFVVRPREGYQTIDYNYTQSDSFDDPIRAECRGIKFDSEGNIITRPLHKFFNLHEKPLAMPDFDQDHIVMDKLDGSMIHAAMLNGDIVFMTRAGITDQAKMALEFVQDKARCAYGYNLLTFCAIALRCSLTPIFEFTSPHNQIVVKYTEENLTLLAVRHMRNGEYCEFDYVETVGTSYQIPAVRTFANTAKDIAAFTDHVKGLEDAEGYVVRVGQHFVKMKADAYCLRHRAKSGLLFEKDVLRLILTDQLDDTIGFLSDAEADTVTKWATLVQLELAIAASSIGGAVAGIKSMTPNRKDFAFRLTNELDTSAQYTKPLAWSIYDGAEPIASLRALGAKRCSSTSNAREFLASLGIPPWKPIMFNAEG